jgi:hypothetical protein
MLDAIRFLENAGRETMSADDYASAVAVLEVSAPEREALLGRDSVALASLLQARASMFFGVFAPEEEPVDDEPFEDQPDQPADAEIRL